MGYRYGLYKSFDELIDMMRKMYKKSGLNNVLQKCNLFICLYTRDRVLLS